MAFLILFMAFVFRFAFRELVENDVGDRDADQAASAPPDNKTDEHQQDGYAHETKDEIIDEIAYQECRPDKDKYKGYGQDGSEHTYGDQRGKDTGDPVRGAQPGFVDPYMHIIAHMIHEVLHFFKVVHMLMFMNINLQRMRSGGHDGRHGRR